MSSPTQFEQQTSAEINDATIQEHLKKLGFIPSETCPQGVNRWYCTDGKYGKQPSSYYASFTLNDNGNKLLYGFVTFHDPIDGTIIKKHKLTCESGDANVIDKMLDKDLKELPKNVKRFVCKPNLININ